MHADRLCGQGNGVARHDGHQPGVEKPDQPLCRCLGPMHHGIGPRARHQATVWQIGPVGENLGIGRQACRAPCCFQLGAGNRQDRQPPRQRLDCRGNRIGHFAPVSGQIGQSAMCLDVGHLCPGQRRHPLQRPDLCRNHARDLDRLHWNDPAAKAQRVGIAGMRADHDTALGRQAQRGKHGVRVACMPAAGDIGRGDNPQHRRIIAHGPRAKALTQIGI